MAPHKSSWPAFSSYHTLTNYSVFKSSRDGWFGFFLERLPFFLTFGCHFVGFWVLKKNDPKDRVYSLSNKNLMCIIHCLFVHTLLICWLRCLINDIKIKIKFQIILFGSKGFLKLENLFEKLKISRRQVTSKECGLWIQQVRLGIKLLISHTNAQL